MWLIQVNPNPFSFPDFLDLTEKLSGVAIALMFFWGLYRGWFVLGREVEEMRRQRDFWQTKYFEERAARDAERH